MRKVDSFIKECQRLEGIASGKCLCTHSMHQLLKLFNPLVGLTRKALKDFTFSDGTFVPKGTVVVAAIRSIHYDETFYENVHTFKPFRFSDLHEEDGEGVKHQFTLTRTEYLPFGHGRYAWYDLSFPPFPTIMNKPSLMV